MNVLLIGAGGREHALAWKIAQSPQLDTLYCAPGNAGMAEIATCLDLDINNHHRIVSFCQANDIKLVIVGPEQPLVDGLVDTLEVAGIAGFGPSRQAAQLEGSKGFTKDLCARCDIPTAAYRRFDHMDEAMAYVQGHSMPLVIKADGLAAGKGVFIVESVDEAEKAVAECFTGSLGGEGAEVVVEAFLKGEEASMFFLCDGETALPFGTAQDHKRLKDGDKGPNTGGMGAYSPAPLMDDALIEQTIAKIINPTLESMRMLGMPYRGVLYAGLMINEDGPQLIEYNARFGDPECQTLMMRLESDILPLLMASATGSLAGMDVKWSDDKALTVVLAAKGYPGACEKGSKIAGLEGINDDTHHVFHAGTAIKDGHLVANGGRVLNVTALGNTVGEAKTRAYEALKKIDWPQGFYRSDIGWRAVEREKA